MQQSIGIDGLELIFVDDASDDAGATWALLEEFERAYPESIMIIHLEENLRQGGARNVALGYATGEYLAFVDADDFVEKDFLEKVYRRAVREPNIFLVGCYRKDLKSAVEGRTAADESIRIQTKEERKRFLISEKITYGCWNKLYRRALVEKAESTMPSMSFMKNRCSCTRCCFTELPEIMAEAFLLLPQNETGTMRGICRQMETLQMIRCAVCHGIL